MGLRDWGQPNDSGNRIKKERLLAVALLYPEIIFSKRKEDDHPSCSAVEALTRQEAFSNQNLAYQALALLAQLLRQGSPDIVCIIKGRYVGLEVKTPKGKLSEDQAEFHRQILKAGGIVFTVRSLDEAMDAVEDALLRLTINPAA